MKVFISWSGENSHMVAKCLRDWLPSVVQSIVPYVSSEDIDKGARWSTDIASELENAAFGILCVTSENVNAPWLNFEAGALSKSIDKSRVCPCLFRIKRSEVQGPILQFQSTVFERLDIFKLVKALNDACAEFGIEESRLEKAFNVWWPQLEASLGQIGLEIAKEDDSRKVENWNAQISNILEEVLEVSRTNQRLLRDPSALFPREFLEFLSEGIAIRQRLAPSNKQRRADMEVIVGMYETLGLKLREAQRAISMMQESPHGVEKWLAHLTQSMNSIREVLVKSAMTLEAYPAIEALEIDVDSVVRRHKLKSAIRKD